VPGRQALRCEEGLELTRRVRALQVASVGGGHALEAVGLDAVLTVWRAALRRRAAERVRRLSEATRRTGRKA